MLLEASSPPPGDFTLTHCQLHTLSLIQLVLAKDRVCCGQIAASPVTGHYCPGVLLAILGLTLTSAGLQQNKTPRINADKNPRKSYPATSVGVQQGHAESLIVQVPQDSPTGTH